MRYGQMMEFFCDNYSGELAQIIFYSRLIWDFDDECDNFMFGRDGFGCGELESAGGV